MKGPWRSRILPIRFGVTKVSAREAKNLRFAVTGHISPCRRFAIDDIQNLVPFPMFAAIVGWFALGVFVPRSVFAGITVNQNVIPTVLVEIVSESKEVI